MFPAKRIQVSRLLALHSLVMETAIVQNFEGMPSGTCLIQGLCKASKPTKDLLCSTRVGFLKHFLEPQPVQGVTGAIL